MCIPELRTHVLRVAVASSALSRAYHTAVSFGLTPESSHYVLGITHTALVGLLRGKNSMSLCAFFKKYNEHVAIVVHMRYRITRVSDRAIPVSEFYRLIDIVQP